MVLMADDAKTTLEHGRAVMELSRATRTARRQVRAEARLQRRRGRRLRDHALDIRERNLDLGWRLWSMRALPEPPSTIPLSWGPPPDSAQRLQAAFNAAEECADACAAALHETTGKGKGRRTLAVISGVCRFVADTSRDVDPDTRRALGLCVRVIESSSVALDEVGRTAGGTLAASSARRCARECSRALTASYLDVEED
jgi:hypothetical protein